jgi:hypothetical protein
MQTSIEAALREGTLQVKDGRGGRSSWRAAAQGLHVRARMAAINCVGAMCAK